MRDSSFELSAARSAARTFTAACLALALAAGCAQTEPAPEPVSGYPADGRWRPIGTSVQGREIVAATLGEGGYRVYVIAGIHGDERPGVENAERLLRLLRDGTDMSGVVVRLVRDANPDGRSGLPWGRCAT